jgi:hypothetical protein
MLGVIGVTLQCWQNKVGENGGVALLGSTMHSRASSLITLSLSFLF